MHSYTDIFIKYTSNTQGRQYQQLPVFVWPQFMACTNSALPIVDARLSQLHKLAQNSGSIVISPSKTEMAKKREDAPVVLKFQGEASLRDYASGTSIESLSIVKSDDTIPRGLVDTLPSRCLLYQKHQQFYCGSEVTLEDGVIFLEQNIYLQQKQVGCLQPNWSSQDRNQQTDRKLGKMKALSYTLSTLPKSSVLFRVQTIAFYPLSFTNFKQIFAYNLFYNKRTLTQSTACLTQTINIPATFSHHNITKAYGEQYLREDNQVLFYDVAEHSTDLLDFTIFKQLCVKEIDWCLWPCLVLQPIVGSPLNVEKLTDKESLLWSQVNAEDQVAIFRNAIGTINNGQSIRSCRLQGEQQQIKEIQGKITVSKSQQHPSRIVKLLGTNKTIKTTMNLLPWLTFTEHQLAAILDRPHISIMAHCLNRHISSLNSHKIIQHLPSSHGHCLGRVCKYHTPQGEPDEICIALKQNPTTQSKNIYIRMLNPSNQAYLWVSQSALTINLTLPHFTLPEDFQKVALQLSVEDTIRFILKDRQHTQDKFFQVMPDHSRQESQEQIQKLCPKCTKALSPIDISSKQCRHCINLHNQQLEQYLKSIDSSYSLQSQLCPVCTTLKQAYTLRCCKCQRDYHWQCLNDHPIAESQSKHAQVVCTQCMWCDFCRQPISSVPYLTKSKLYCQQCHFEQEIYAFCVVCSCKIGYESALQCSDQACAKRVHHSCDPLVTQQLLLNNLKYSYLCPQSRLYLRRKLLRWVLQDLRIFDQCQYYCDPCYQQFADYDKVIKNPMCLAIMRERTVQGFYDCNSFQKLKKDFELIIKNALTFNAPHDDAYYRAKIFYIVGMQFLVYCRDLVQINELQLMNVSLQQLFESRVKQFFNFLKRNYAGLILNHQQEKVIVEVQMPNTRHYYQRFLFKSRELLQAQLERYPLKVRIKLEHHSIHNLFNTIPKRKPIVASLTRKICFRHPQDTHPLVYQCNRCWEYYCCSKACPCDSGCHKCPEQNCTCSSRMSQCKCNGRVSDYIKQKVLQFAAEQPLTIDDVTQYSRYCLRCAQRNIVNSRCFHCQRFCYYGYQQCKYCKKYEHLACLQSKLRRQCRIGEQLQGWDLDISKVKECCSECISKCTEYSMALLKQLKTNSQKIIKQQKYLPIVLELFRSQGIAIDSHRSVYALLKGSQGELSKIEVFLDEMARNRGTISNLLLLLEKENAQDLNRLIEHCGSLCSKQIYTCFQQLIDKDLKETLNVYEQQERNVSTFRNKIHGESQQQRINVWPFFQSNKNRNILFVPTQQQIRPLPAFKSYQSQDSHLFYQAHHQHHLINQIQHSVKQISESQPRQVRNVDIKWQAKLKYVTAVLLSIYRDNQKVLKHGNTCILKKSQDYWKCLKYYQDTQYTFQLYKESSQWYYAINNNIYPVADTTEIIQRTSNVNHYIANNQDLIAFLGFDIEIQVIQNACFSELLKKPTLVDRSRIQRKTIVEAAYAKSPVAEEKEVVDRVTKDKNKRSIFYLNKRQKQMPIKQPIDSRLNVKVTLHELKRDLNLQPRSEKAEVADSKLRFMDEGALYVAPSQIDRLGIFTTQPIEKNTIVIEYKGQLISQAIANKRERSYRFGCYMFSLDQSAPERATVIDATFKGNMARYLNHSCSPNCRGKIFRSNKQPAIVIYTIRKVRAYQQLTYNYEFKKETNQIIECKCKAPNCQQRLN